MCFLNENKTEAFLLRVLIEVGRRATTSKTKQRVCTHHQLHLVYIFALCSMKVNAFHHDYTNHLTRETLLSKFIKVLTQPSNHPTPQKVCAQFESEVALFIKKEYIRVSVPSKYRTDTFVISREHLSVICRCFFVQSRSMCYK